MHKNVFCPGKETLQNRRNALAAARWVNRSAANLVNFFQDRGRLALQRHRVGGGALMMEGPSLTNSRFLRGAPCPDSSNKVSDVPGRNAFISTDRES